jgi:hypothetical protein
LLQHKKMFKVFWLGFEPRIPRILLSFLQHAEELKNLSSCRRVTCVMHFCTTMSAFAFLLFLAEFFLFPPSFPLPLVSSPLFIFFVFVLCAYLASADWSVCL